MKGDILQHKKNIFMAKTTDRQIDIQTDKLHTIKVKQRTDTLSNPTT